MNLMRKPPMGLKQPIPGADLEHLRRVRELPCCICEAFGLQQTTPTTAHHTIHGRYSQRKRPDRMAIPLCDGCHQGNFDNTKVAVHREPNKWKRLYGEDTNWVAPTLDKIEKAYGEDQWKR